MIHLPASASYRLNFITVDVQDGAREDFPLSSFVAITQGKNEIHGMVLALSEGDAPRDLRITLAPFGQTPVAQIRRLPSYVSPPPPAVKTIAE